VLAGAAPDAGPDIGIGEDVGTPWRGGWRLFLIPPHPATMEAEKEVRYMAVIGIPVDASLRLVVQVGTDQAGNPVLRNRTYNRVKPEAANDEVFQVAQALAGLMADQVVEVRRQDQRTLAEA